MILIIAPESDLHSQIIKYRIEQKGYDCTILNTTWFPWPSLMTWTTDGCLKHYKDGEVIDFSKVTAIWWRRFHHPTCNPIISDTNVKKFCFSESSSFIKGFFRSLDIPIVNNLDFEMVANSKVLQLKLAKKIGLKVPATLISNNKDDIICFLKSHPFCVCKTLYCDFPHNIETRKCTIDDFENTIMTELAPIIIQELVEAIVDIRIFVVGQQLFAAELSRENINQTVD